MTLISGRYCPALFCAASLLCSTQAATPLSGNVNGTLSASQSPYLAQTDLVVPNGQILIVERGVTIQFEHPADGLYVDGVLTAKGSASAPIVLTSASAQKSPGQWEALIFRGGGTNSVLEYCTIEYGAAAGQADEAVRLEGTSPTLRNCTIRQSRMHGLNAYFSDAVIENCTFANNGSTNVGAYAVLMRADSFPRFSNNQADGNSRNAIGVYGQNISRSGTWVKDSIPYTLVENTFVNGGRILAINPGTVVQFQDPGNNLYVDGSLLARGTSVAPILFTSDEAQKQPGQWGAIVFRGGAADTNSILENCVVEFGGAAGVATEAVRFESTSPVMRSSTIRFGRMHGLNAYFSDAVIESCTFTNNGSTNAGAYAVLIRADSFPRLSNNQAAGNPHNAIGIYGQNISRSGTWLKDNIPYTVTENTVVNGGQKLTIGAGAVVQFQDPGNNFYVDGSLLARGAPAAPILFTSDEAQKQPGQWGAIVFRGGAADTNSILENCVVEFGGAAGVANEAIRFESTSPVMRSSTIRFSQMHGLNAFFSDAVIENCTFANNGSTNAGAYAVFMRADSFPRFSNNQAAGNPHNAIGVYGQNISRSGTWVKDNIPYTLAENTYVNGGRILVINAGTVVQFQDAGNNLYVDGSLVARGTTAAPILFTPDAAQKQPGQWGAIVFRGGAADTNSILENCVVEFGGAAGVATEAVRFESTSPVMRNSTIRSSWMHGLNAYFSDAVIENCTFTNNGSTNAEAYAVLMRADSFPRFSNNQAAGNPHNAIGVYGQNISRSGTWVKDNIPYTLTDNTFINGGRKLTIDPGTVVQFQDPGNNFYVDGSLLARGAPSAPIFFTSDKAQKQPGQWGALVFRGGAADTNSILEYCVMEFGGASGVAGEAVRFEGTSPVMRSSAIRSSRMHGLNLYLSDAVIENCTFADNGSTNAGAYAVVMRADSLPRFSRNQATGNPHNAIGIYGQNISRSGRWLKDNIPYTLTENTFVNQGVQLGLDPGSIIQLPPSVSLFVDGVLTARGLPGSQISFTSESVVKAPGQWSSLHFRNPAAGSILEYCIVEFGGQGAAMLVSQGSPLRLNRSIVRQSISDGVEFNGGAPTILASFIQANRGHGIRTLNRSAAVIQQSGILGNALLGVENSDTSVIIDARSNYWGDASGPFDNSNVDNRNQLNPGSKGDKVSEFVDWSDPLSSPPSSLDGPQNCLPAPASLVGLWRGEGNALDETGLNNGTARNGLLFASGISNLAFAFDGADDIVEIPDSPSLYATNAITIMTWIKPASLGGIVSVISKSSSTTNTGFIFPRWDGLVFGSFCLNIAGQGWVHNAFDWTSIPDPFAWHHVALTYDGARVRTFVDGQIKKETPLTGAISQNQNRLVFGTQPGFPEAFQGSMDEVAIFSSGLSPEQVLAIYNTGSASFCGNPSQTIMLRVTRTGTGIQLRWPDHASGFSLQSTAKLGVNPWNVVPNGVITTNGEFVVTVQPASSAGFYRLIRP